MPALMPAAGFTLLRELATGPMSTLFVARRDEGSHSTLVAVKSLTVRHERDVEMMLRLCAQQRHLARLNHRHIVCQTELVAIGDVPALVSPFVSGIDVLDWAEILVEQGIWLPGRVVCDVMAAVACALDVAADRVPYGQAEALAMLHRDLKPSNVLIDRDGEVKVVDFSCGFTSLAGRHGHRGALQKGLIKYMSPERREGRRTTSASDVYSMGIMAIELFRARWLRRLRSTNPAHDRHLSDVVANIAELGLKSAADEAQLRSMLLRMVAYDEEARPNAVEVAHAFRTLADRARGASLATFAQAYALPCIEPVPEMPDEHLRALTLCLLPEGSLATDLPVDEKFQGMALHERTLDTTSFWEETADGWRQSHWQEETRDLRTVGALDAEEAAPPVNLRSEPDLVLVKPPTPQHADEDVADAFSAGELPVTAEITEIVPPPTSDSPVAWRGHQEVEELERPALVKAKQKQPATSFAMALLGGASAALLLGGGAIAVGLYLYL